MFMTSHFKRNLCAKILKRILNEVRISENVHQPKQKWQHFVNFSCLERHKIKKKREQSTSFM